MLLSKFSFRSLTRYKKHLASRQEIDFEDMITNATEYVKLGKVKRYYRYILVDEFQDISQCRHKLLRAILDMAPDSRVFAVGDDWQSIFRFAGSDLNVMTQFEQYYGDSERLFIDESFRFNSKICDFSTKFILENPSQIQKQSKVKEVIMHPAVSLVYTRNPQEDVKKILAHLNQDGGVVYILGSRTARADHPPLSQSADFVLHSSRGQRKGSGLCNCPWPRIRSWGFPCEIIDDPVLRLVTPKPETYPNAEERRLFYVAITRAKKHIYLLADPDKPSSFVTVATSERIRTAKRRRTRKEEQRVSKVRRGSRKKKQR